MADDAPVSEDANVEDVSLLEAPPAAPEEDKPSESEEEAKVEASDTQDKPDKEADEAKDTEAKEDDSQDPQEEQEPEKGKPDPERARQAYLERQRTRLQVAQQIDQNFAPKSQDDLVEEGMNEQQAAIEALRQEMQFKEQRAQIAEMNAGLQADAVNVMNDFEVFNPNSKSYDEDFANQVQQAYTTASRLQTDDSGIVLNAEVGLYDFYKQMADIYGRGTAKGSEQGNKEALQMLSRTENPGGSPPTSSGNSLQDLEDKIGDVVIT